MNSCKEAFSSVIRPTETCYLVLGVASILSDYVTLFVNDTVGLIAGSGNLIRRCVSSARVGEHSDTEWVSTAKRLCGAEVVNTNI